MKKKEKNQEAEDSLINLNIIYEEESDLEHLLETEEFQNFIIVESFKRVKKAVEEKLDKIILFTISNLLLTVEVDKNNYKPILLTSLDYYARIEDYKKCSEIKNFIETHKL